MDAHRFPIGPSEALLRAEGVTLDYRSGAASVRALENVSFEVVRGDRLVLPGPSGCGKSTLLKAIAGFITPRAGSLTLDGRTIVRPGPDRIVVFQEFDQLPPWKTVKGNMMFPLLAGGMARAEAQARALHWIGKVGLAPFADAFPHTLSGGMKARVAIARALAMQPAILLMDGALRRARRAHAPQHAGGTANFVGGKPLHDAVRHPFNRGSTGGRQPHRAAVAPSGPRAR